MPDLDIRIAKEKDLDGIIKFLSNPVVDKMFIPPLSERKEPIDRRVIDKYNRGLWVIISNNGQIIGCRAIINHKSENYSEFSTFAIHPNYQGQGLGSRLYQFCIDICVEKYNPRKIRIDSWTGNKAAEALAYKFQFHKVREYDDPEKRPHGVKTVVYERDFI